MKHIPNILSASRIVLALSLLLTKPLSIQFFIVYIVCGATDILDGIIARRYKVVSVFGSKLDSIADVLVTLVMLFLILPLVNPPLGIVIWILSIIAFRLVSVAVAYVSHHKAMLLHTTSNRVVAWALFFYPFTLLVFFDPVIVPFFLCLIASLAALEELMIIIVAPTPLNPDIKSYRAMLSNMNMR